MTETLDHDRFLAEARAAYVDANARSLAWMLARPALHGAFLNTKQNSLTLENYTDRDGWRTPRVLYGWIQGRGLEALVRHGEFFKTERPDLAGKLDAAASALFHALADLYGRHGQAFFSYDANLNPVFPGAKDEPVAQHRAAHLATYSDIFVLKGLVAASRRFDPARTQSYLDALARVVTAVEENRFVSDERRALRDDAVGQRRDYGPRMILLGAAAMLREFGFDREAAFGDRFIAFVLDRHVEDGRGAEAAGTVRDVPGGDACNPGHAIEFAGFAFESLPQATERATVERLETVLLRSFELGFSPPGIRASVSLAGDAQSPYRPWWSLPETVRAASLAYCRTRNPASLKVWRQAHRAFFSHYWRSDPPIAYQTLSDEGPVDYVPATPDLDPGYHTGLSFLTAIRAIDALAPRAG
jgi:hypothetical protein